MPAFEKKGSSSTGRARSPMSGGLTRLFCQNTEALLLERAGKSIEWAQEIRPWEPWPANRK